MERCREAAESVFGELRRSFPDADARFEEPMCRHTTFRIGGPVSAMFFPAGEEELLLLLQLLHRAGVSPLILGNGSNLLCSDGPMDLVAISTRSLQTVEFTDETHLRAGAGTLLRRAAEAAAERSLGGMECLHGIPGTVGGGVFMNAGAYGGEIKDVLASVRAADREGRALELTNRQLELAYRHSLLEETGGIVLSALFTLQPAPQEEIRARMEELAEKRRSKQPLDKPSAGSTFKRPREGYAAAMIDGAGLKGRGVGGARVSEKHAGFVINGGGATCEDVLATMRMVRAAVLEKYGVLLEPEVRLVGVSL